MLIHDIFVYVILGKDELDSLLSGWYTNLLKIKDGFLHDSSREELRLISKELQEINNRFSYYHSMVEKWGQTFLTLKKEVQVLKIDLKLSLLSYEIVLQNNNKINHDCQALPTREATTIWDTNCAQIQCIVNTATQVGRTSVMCDVAVQVEEYFLKKNEFLQVEVATQVEIVQVEEDIQVENELLLDHQEGNVTSKDET